MADRKIAHQELWKKYDFSMSPLDPLPGVNLRQFIKIIQVLKTKKMKMGWFRCFRMYFDITITLTENGTC